jgi:hypothetical protein
MGDTLQYVVDITVLPLGCPSFLLLELTTLNLLNFIAFPLHKTNLTAAVRH